jgi:hypothetical protein
LKEEKKMGSQLLRDDIKKACPEDEPHPFLPSPIIFFLVSGKFY